MLKLGVLISGNGSNLQAIIDACENGSLQAVIAVVISNKESAYGLERARKHGLNNIFIDPKMFDTRQDYDTEILKHLKENDVELVVHAGYMRLISDMLLEAYPMRHINVHPSLLPSFPGISAIKDAYEYGVKITGVTIHFVDSGIDTGPVILQDIVRIEENDSLESLEDKVHAVEHRLYPQALKLYIEGKLEVNGRKVQITS